MKLIHSPLRTTSRLHVRGFSLVELLSAIAIVSIVSMIALPMLTSQSDQAKATRAKMNAATIANAAQMAMASGDSTVCRCTTIDEALTLLVQGVHGAGGLANNIVSISRLGAQEVTEAKAHLQFANGLLTMK